ncbi:MAG: hypothetical protein J6X50_00115 [Bacilli bacterium]|nr:hypothetical protein [Bacilli bacterium]
MKQLTLNDCVLLNEQEQKRIENLIGNHDKNFHYLAFDRQLHGFSPLGSFLGDARDILAKEQEIMDSLIEKQEVCSLYPRVLLTLYPIRRIDYERYELELNNISKHFTDILELNDQVYKTKYLFVDFGHGAANFDQDLLYEMLRNLLRKSNLLEAIYILQL